MNEDHNEDSEWENDDSYEENAGASNIGMPMPVSYKKGNTLVLKYGATIPTTVCVKTNEPADHVVTKSIRNPFNPLTWIGRTPKLELGLSKKHYDNYRAFLAGSWATFALGIIFLLVSIFTFSPLMFLVSFLIIAAAGVFRSINPVWSTTVSHRFVALRGTCAKFRENFRTEEE